MIRIGMILVVGIFATFLFAAPSRADGINDYLGKDGMLKKKVVFETALTAQFSWYGSRWVIEPSGEWAFYGCRIAEPVSRGKLTEKQVSALAQNLAAQNFSKLPILMGWTKEETPKGTFPEWHATVVVISFGEKSTFFYAKSDATKFDYLGAPGTPEADEWLRFVALELFLRELLNHSEKKAQ